MLLNSRALENTLNLFFAEDDLSRNFHYINSLPDDMVSCQLKFKDDMTIAGLPYFFEAFNFLSKNFIDYKEFLVFEGSSVLKSDRKEIHFDLPFNVVLTAERIALNLLQKASSIATYTSKFTRLANKEGISILDTRKTTPGHRAIEKYGVQIGGGKNHRFGQADCWMIKDNHKSFFGGLENALNYFEQMNSFYTPVVVEIHNLEELKEGFELNIKHFMLDNFTPEEVKEAINIKKSHITYEISGGINLDNIDSYLIPGVDAISSGSLTYNAPHVDISLKYNRK
jgi:nicotinate-nucleotide pyrophosphorylase (carboxylating)